jgi:hypothetical protein
MNATDVKLRELHQRIDRNRLLYLNGAAVGEREQLKREIAGPLVGVAFLTGIACGSGPGFVYALRDPLIRNTLGAFSSLIGES